jgi:hypothetical protein
MNTQTESMIAANKSMYIGAGPLRTWIVIIINDIFSTGIFGRSSGTDRFLSIKILVLFNLLRCIPDSYGASY